MLIDGSLQLAAEPFAAAGFAGACAHAAPAASPSTPAHANRFMPALREAGRPGDPEEALYRRSSGGRREAGGGRPGGTLARAPRTRQLVIPRSMWSITCA